MNRIEPLAFPVRVEAINRFQDVPPKTVVRPLGKRHPKTGAKEILNTLSMQKPEILGVRRNDMRRQYLLSMQLESATINFCERLDSE